MSSINEEKEARYESEVHRNAYRLRIKVEILEGAAYLVSGTERELLCRPLIAKHFWYETWLALKEQYGDLPHFIRMPGGRSK